MNIRHRFGLEMLLIALLALVAAIVVVTIPSTSSAASRCRTADVLGFAVVTGDRLTGPSGVPSTFQTAQAYFLRRYNCTGRLVQVRKAERGVYEVIFPGNRAVAPVAEALADDGSWASAARIAPGHFRIRLTGPMIDQNHLVPRDGPFMIALMG